MRRVTVVTTQKLVYYVPDAVTKQGTKAYMADHEPALQESVSTRIEYDDGTVETLSGKTPTKDQS